MLFSPAGSFDDEQLFYLSRGSDPYPDRSSPSIQYSIRQRSRRATSIAIDNNIRIYRARGCIFVNIYIYIYFSDISAYRAARA
jgi:hypothetical protein